MCGATTCNRHFFEVTSGLPDTCGATMGLPDTCGDTRGLTDICGATMGLPDTCGDTRGLKNNFVTIEFFKECFS